MFFESRLVIALAESDSAEQKCWMNDAGLATLNPIRLAGACPEWVFDMIADDLIFNTGNVCEPVRNYCRCFR